MHADPREHPRFTDLFQRYVEELQDQGFIDPDAIIESHPELGPALVEDLETYTQLRPVGESAPEAPLGKLGDYTLRRQIGRGGMGVVYEAWQGSVERTVALKVLPPAIAADDRAYGRFMQEARAAGKLSHPNVVAVHASGQDESTPYYAMEYVDGQTLAQVLKRIRDVDEHVETEFGKKGEVAFYSNLADAFADAADGLQHAHSKGVVHRDIKPSNLILDGDGRLRILDFGLALLEGQEGLTVSGDFVGTPLYMSPEQARRKKIEVDHRTDIYSIGATMYEALTGRPPFRGKDHQDTLSQIVQRDVVDPHKFNARVPRELETVVLKCLRKDPRDRYGTAEALAQDLRRVVRGAPIEARPRSGWEKSIQFIRTRKRAIVFLAAAILSVVATVLYVSERYVTWRKDQKAQYELLVTSGVLILQASLLRTRAGEAGSLAVDTHREVFLPADQTLLDAGSLESALAVFDRAVKYLPGEPDAYYHRARTRFLRGEDAQAEEDLDRCLARDANFLPAATLRAVLGEEADSRTSLLSAERPIALDPYGIRKLWEVAHRTMARGSWREATRAYDELLELERAGEVPYVGASVELLLGRGVAQLQEGRARDAIEDFTAACDRWPDAFEPALLLGKAYLSEKAYRDAERVFQRAYDRANDSEERDQVALAVVSAWWQHGHQKKVARKWAEDKIQGEYLRDRTKVILLKSQGEYEEAIRLGVEFDKRYPEEDVQVHIVVGGSHARLGKFQTAEWWLKKARRLDPTNPYAANALAYTYGQLGQIDKAEQQYKDATRLAPSWDASFCNWGLLLERIGRVAEAEEKYREALLFDREGTGNSIWRGVPRRMLCANLIRQGKLAAAVEEIRIALEVARENFGRARLHRILGDALRLQEKPVEAFAAYARAVALYSADARESCLKLFTIHFGLDAPGVPAAQWDDIVSELEVATVGDFQDRPWLRVVLGLGYLNGQQKEDLDKARAWVELAVAESDRKGPAALAALAEVDWNEGDRTTAVRTLERVLRMPGGNHVLQRRLRVWREKTQYLASRESMDAALHRWEPDPERDLALLDAYRREGPAEDGEHQLRYLEARVLQRAGQYDQAIAKFHELINARESSVGVVLHLAESLRSIGKVESARGVLRKATSNRYRNVPALWHLWLDLALTDARQSPGQLLEELTASTAYGRDIRWVLRLLNDGQSLRINCGGGEVGSEKGGTWGRDRFYLGGWRRKDPVMIAKNGDGSFLGTRRFFRERDRAGYRVPLPRDRYTVTLHFCETWYAASGLRSFDVVVEGKKAEAIEPYAAGFATPHTYESEVTVTDGVLDIDFLRGKGDPFIVGIEIEVGG